MSIKPTDATVRTFLDLATRHLPPHLGVDGLAQADGVVAYETAYGYLMWVPDDPAGSAEAHAAHWKEEMPSEVLVIQIYARSLGCDYVMFDADGAHNDDLPTWHW